MNHCTCCIYKIIYFVKQWPVYSKNKNILFLLHLGNHDKSIYNLFMKTNNYTFTLRSKKVSYAPVKKVPPRNKKVLLVQPLKKPRAAIIAPRRFIPFRVIRHFLRSNKTSPRGSLRGIITALFYAGYGWLPRRGGGGWLVARSGLVLRYTGHRPHFSISILTSNLAISKHPPLFRLTLNSPSSPPIYRYRGGGAHLVGLLYPFTSTEDG